MVDYDLKPGDNLYPENDPRFQNPNTPLPHPRDAFDKETGMNFPPDRGPGRELAVGHHEPPDRHENQES